MFMSLQRSLPQKPQIRVLPPRIDVSSWFKLVLDAVRANRSNRRIEFWRIQIYYLNICRSRALAKLSILSLSRFVVGSSSAKIPELRQNVSAKANLIIILANTFWPALHLPLMSKQVSPLISTTL
ncbi:hypothetical protein BpHYR1_001801 [Brachionus plicatilis]|uniref:Uncharacterized protein n=1 Tax=Brachionus plicatilis TaxID=10195 RepID=A0A3M7T9D8_BRAPC|nr:hypothetical protein BpHYR1_001801 [Brachionus plicatilis]